MSIKTEDTIITNISRLSFFYGLGFNFPCYSWRGFSLWISFIWFVYTYNRIFVFMLKIDDKRKARSYKIYDKVYAKAMRRAAKQKQKLATLIEIAVHDYAHGNKNSTLDL